MRSKVSEIMKCPREEDFVELYGLLGDGEAQDRVREQNPRNRHCKWLRESPLACEELPYDIGEGGVCGGSCPNNPFQEHKELFDELAENSSVLEEIGYAEDLILMDMVPRDLNTHKFKFFAIVKRVFNLQDKLLSSSIPMFGGGQEKK